MRRRQSPVRPDPLSQAAARRHELTRAKAVQTLRELDRAGTPVTFASVAQAAEVSRSWLYTKPDISGQIRRLREKTHGAGSAGTIPAGQRPPRRRCAPGSPPPSTATSNSRTRTPGSAARSPAHSATSGQPAPPARRAGPGRACTPRRPRPWRPEPPGRPQPAPATHRFALIRDTRNRFTISRSLAPASIISSAASRTRSRRARSAASRPPPSGYLMTPA